MTTNSSHGDAGPDAPVAPASGITTYRLIREGRAPKIGVYSTGFIFFQILLDNARQNVFLRIAANEGGGYVSNEAVSIHAIVRCITELEVGQVLRSGAFKFAFKTGRSVNNHGFLCAVLLAEGLLSRDTDHPHVLIDTGQWQDWCARQLGVDGDLPCIRVGKEATAVMQANPVQTPDGDPDASASGDSDVAAADPDHGPEDETPVDEPTRPGRKARKGRMAEHV